MTTVPPPRVGLDTDSVPVTLARLEGKVDVALAQHGAAIASHEREIADHETRIRAVEAKPTVSPKTLWSAIVGAAGVLAAVAPFLERLYALHP